MKKIALFLAEGFEEIEALTPVDMCRRAEIEVTTVSITGETEVKGSHGIPVKADTILREMGELSEYDMLVLPGGGAGTQNLEESGELAELLKKADKEEKRIAAICAAPRILGKLNLLQGKKATCFPGNETFLNGAEYHPEKKAVIDGRFITARGMGAAVEFGAAIIEVLEGKEKAEEILKKIQF